MLVVKTVEQPPEVYFATVFQVSIFKLSNLLISRPKS